MADNFLVPSRLPEDDPGVNIYALERTVAGVTAKVGVTVNVDPDDPTKRQHVDETYGAAVEIKRLPGTVQSDIGSTKASLETIAADIALIKAALDVPVSTLTTPADTQPVSGSVSVSDTVQSQGDVAHDHVDSGNPVKVGAVAVAFGASPAAVEEGDRTNLLANRHGIIFVLGGHPAAITRQDNFTAAQMNTAIVSVPPGSRMVVTKISALAANANTVDVAVRVGFGTASTPTGVGVVLSHPGVAKGSGVVEGNGGAVLGFGADDEDLRITCGVPTGGSIDVVTTYFIIPS